MKKVNEQTTVVIDIDFYDEDGEPDIPTTGHYRLDDKITGDAIIASTAMTIVDYTYRITIPSASVTIRDTNNESEVKVLTVDWTDGGYVGRSVIEFEVVNLEKVT